MVLEDMKYNQCKIKLLLLLLATMPVIILGLNPFRWDLCLGAIITVFTNILLMCQIFPNLIF
jgi:hypothetical protein